MADMNGTHSFELLRNQRARDRILTLLNHFFRRRFFFGARTRRLASRGSSLSAMSGSSSPSAKARAILRTRRRFASGFIPRSVLMSTRSMRRPAISCGRYLIRSIRALNSGHSAYRRLIYVHGSRTTRISSSICERLPRIFASSSSSASCWRSCSAVLRPGGCRRISSINSWYRLRASAFVLDRGMIQL